MLQCYKTRGSVRLNQTYTDNLSCFDIFFTLKTFWHDFGSTVSRIFNINNVKILKIMNIKPLADRVLVVPAPAEQKVGGIIIPDTVKEKPLRGKVVAVGHGTKDEQMVLKEGDEVLYGKYSGTELELDGEKYLIMRQSDVLAVLA